VNADGTSQARLTDEAALLSDPVWSPDATKIAFVNQSSGEIYVMNANGSGLSNLTNTDDAEDYDPTWSPDSLKIAFASNRGDIWVMNADGSDQVKVTNTGRGADRPAWSPDGAKIAFVTHDDWDLHVVNPDGSGLLRLSEDGRCETDEFAWSPDSTKIAFTSLTGCSGRRIISVIDADGTNLRSIVSQPPAPPTEETKFWARLDWQALPDER